MPTEDNDEYHQYEIDKVDGEKVFPFKSKPVSYTHLTLPTICSV